MGLFSGITGIIGGIQSASAVSNAADERIKGYQQSADTVDRTTQGVNESVGGAYSQAGRNVLDTANGAAGGVLNASQVAADGVNTSVRQANELYNPYLANGANASTTLSEMFAPGGEGNKTFTSADMEADSGYQFRIDKAVQALQRSAAARGGVMGGAALKSLNREVQGVASSEYDAAFNRFRTGQNDRFTKLSTLAGQGLTASHAAGSNLTRGAEVVGNYGVTGEKVAGDYRVGAQTYASNAGIESANVQGRNSMNAGLYRAGAESGIADARASEHIGRANAWNNTLTAVGSAADGFIAGGFNGGGGFKIRDAFRGYAR